jgi:DNA-binding transcriptional MerR regulator
MPLGREEPAVAENASEIPRKEFYKLSELCQYTDVQPYVVRFWETEFPQLNPERRGGSQPLYRREHIELVRRIKQLLHEEECTLAAARARLGEGIDLDDEPRAGRETADRGLDPPLVAPAARAGEEAVSRQRYEDAVDEIDTLRLQLKEADRLRRKAELQAREAAERAEHYRARALEASTRIEGLLATLDNQISST